MKNLFSIGLAILGGALLYESIRSKKVFVSYKYDGDAKYKNLLVAWSKNHKFEVQFDDVSSNISINSRDESVIKKGIIPQIKEADIFLCIVGDRTHKSKMVAWEIEQATFFKKKVVAVKTSKNNMTPDVLMNIGAEWAMSFTEKSIMKALNNVSI